MRRMALEKKNNQLQIDSLEKMSFCKIPQNMSRRIRTARRRLNKKMCLFDSTAQEFRGEGYAPVFDHLMIYGRQVLRSSEMESWMLWCRNKMNICICKMKEYASVLDYRKKLEETQQKVHELEEKLKEAEKRAAETTLSFKPASVPTPPLPSGPAIPPPPPPPCPTIKTPTSNKLLIVKKSNNTLKSQQSLSQMLVTPEAIRGVKLRKAEDRVTEMKPQNIPGLVTLEALKSVSLRRTQSATTIQEVGKENVHQLLAHEVLHRRALRKTTIKRSPGGTPLSDKKRKRDSGQGLTPVMSRALKRKFRLAKCESMSSDESANSSPNQSMNEPSENTQTSVNNQSSGTILKELSEKTPTDTRTSNENAVCNKMSPCNSAQSYRQSPLATISPNILADSSFLSASSPNLVF